MSSDRSVSRNFLALVTGEVAARVIAFGVVMFVARVLGADGYGVIAFAVGINLYLGKVADFAIEWIGARAIAKQPDRLEKLVAAIMGARLAMALVLTVGTISVVWLFLPDPERMVLSLYCLTILPIAASTKWVHLGLEDARPIGWSRVLGESLGLGVVMGVMLWRAVLWAPPLAQIASEVLVAILLLAVLGRRGHRLRLSWDLKTALPVFRAAWPLLVHMLLGLFIYNSDLIVLRIFRDSAQVGYYAAAYTLISLLANLGITYGMSLLPTMTRYGVGSDEEQGLFQTALTHIWAVCLPVSIGGFLLAGPIIAVAFGAQYEASAIALAVLIWSIPLSISRNVPWSGLIARGREDLLLRAIIVGASVNIVLNLTLIPRYGMMGAALATVATECLVGILMLRFAAGQGLRFAALRRFWRPVVAGLAMAAAVYPVSRLDPLIALVAGVGVGVAVYGAVLALLGGIRFGRGRLPELKL